LHTFDLKLTVRLLAILASSLLFPHVVYGVTEQRREDPVATGSFEVIDDANRRLSFSTRPQRIVSLAPHITELLFSAGAGERIVATSQYSDFPPAAKNIPAIGDAYTVNIEALLELNADLVLVWESGIPIRTIETFDRLNIQYFVSEPKSVSAMINSLRMFGRIAGDVTEANRAAGRLQQRWEQHTSQSSEASRAGDVERTRFGLRLVGGAHEIGNRKARCHQSASAFCAECT